MPAQTRRDIARLRQSAEVMHTLNLGGTAIGSGLNASATYRRFVYEELCRSAGQGIAVRWAVPIRDRVLRDGLLEPETLSRLLNPATQCGGEV